MATTKPKTAKKSAGKKTSAKSRAASVKAKTTAKSVAAKTTKKEKVAAKATVKTPKVEAAAKTEKTVVMSEKTNPVKEFFARKGDKNENILTIFKDTRIIGAVIAEIIGTGLVTSIALTLGLFNPLYMIFAYIGITAAVFKLSGAHFNPIITAGMMASRRVSAIRGELYIIAQILGAWFAFMIISAFYNVGIASGNIDATSTTLPALTAAADLRSTTEGFGGFFWAVTMIEFVGAIIIAFFYARALNYKRGVYTFAAIVGSGVFLAMLFAVVINSTYLGISDNTFIMNPAASMMYGLLPATAEGFDALMSALWPMLVTYVIFPILGGIIGFYLSDILSKFSGQEYAN